MNRQESELSAAFEMPWPEDASDQLRNIIEIRVSQAFAMWLRAAASAFAPSCFLIAAMMSRCSFDATAARPGASKVVPGSSESESASCPSAEVKYWLRAASWIERWKCSLTLLQAEKRLNVSETSMQILLKTGFIHRHRITSGKNDDRYFDYELDQFLQSFSIDAEPIKQKSADVMQLRIVARHAQRSLADIIQLILDRKVRWVGRLPKLKGIEALVLKLDEVKALVRGPTVDGLPAVPASRLLQIPAPVLREIARRGIIKIIRVVDPVNRCPRILFPLAELERFRVEYVSLYLLSEGRNASAVRRGLTAQNIKPAEELAGLDATFYKRSDLKF